MGKVIHFEIPVADSDRAKAFYSEVFGWGVSAYGDFPYWLLEAGPEDQQGINGALMGQESMAEMGPPSTQVVIQVDDLDATIADVLAHGGTLVQGRQTVPGVGYSAYVTDSEGNRIGLMQEDFDAVAPE